MRRFSSSSLIPRILFTYIVAFLVPVLALSLFIYRFAVERAEADWMESQSAATVRIRDAFDREFMDLQKIATQLRTSLGLGRFDLEPTPRYARTTLAELNKYVLTNRFMEDILYFMYGDEILYGSQSVYSPRTLEKTFFAGTGLAAKDLLGMFNSITEISLVSLPQVGPEASEPTVFYFVPVASEFQPYGWICFVVRSTELIRVAEQIVGDNPGSTIILNETGMVLASTPDAYLSGYSLTQEELRNSASSFSDVSVISKGTYIHHLSHSWDHRLTYVRMYDKSIFIRATSSLRWNVILGIAVFILLGSTLVYVFFRLSFDPIRHLRKNIEARLGRPLDDPDELAAIRLGFDSLILEKDAQIQSFLQANKEAIGDYLLLCLVHGDIDTALSFNERAAEAGFQLTKDRYCVVVAEFASYLLFTEQRSNLLEHAKRVLSRGYEVAGNLAPEPGRLLFVIGDMEGSESKQHAYLELLLEDFKELGCGDAAIAAGRFHQSLKMVPRSYLEAISAMEYRFVRGWNAIILYSQFESNDTSILRYPTEELQKLEEAILKGDSTTTESIAHAILEKLRQSGVSLFTARCICFDIVNTCIKTMYRIGVDIGRVGSPIIAANALSNYHTMDELLRLVLVMIEDVRKRIADLGPSDSRTKRMLLKIHEQTEAHFFQQDFSLSELAEHMGMSQSALSHFYRESTKSTLQEYVNTLRLNRAKDLLKQGLPLKAVVPLVGFHDISRFIKKFRKNAGMTPGQYARLYRDQSIR